MAISRTALANLALSRLGQPAISDIDDTGSVTAGNVRVVFEHSVRQMGRLHQWQCLKKRIALTQNTDGPDFGWAYSYNLPDDFIRMITVNDLDAWDQESWYALEGRKLLVDTDTAKIVYVAYVEDSTQYDSLFDEALVVLMAAKLATIIRDDEALGLQLMQEWKISVLPDAVVADGNERYSRPKKPTDNSEWIAARRFVREVPTKLY